MSFWQGMLVVLGCALGCFVIGLLLAHIYQRKKLKEHFLFNQNTDLIKTEDLGFAADQTVDNGQIKSEEQEDLLEELVKNHKNNIISETHQQSTNIDASVDIKTMGEKEEEPSRPKVFETASISQSNRIQIEELASSFESPITREPIDSNQRSAFETEKQTITVVSYHVKKAESTNLKIAKAHAKQKKLTKREVQKNNNINLESIPEGELIQESAESVPSEPALVGQTESQVVGKQNHFPKSDLIIELETNLDISSTYLAGKLVPFQTKIWDSNKVVFDPVMNTHHQELIQLYVDISLANNIVWLATEIGHTSKDLDESYVKLCKVIEDNIEKLLQ